MVRRVHRDKPRPLRVAQCAEHVVRHRADRLGPSQDKTVFDILGRAGERIQERFSLKRTLTRTDLTGRACAAREDPTLKESLEKLPPQQGPKPPRCSIRSV